MPTPKYASLLNRVCCFVLLLLMGLALPIQPVFAQTSTGAPESFGKFLPANGAKDQSVSLQLRWNTSNSTATYEYCIDTVDNNTCDTAWQIPKMADLAAVKLEKNTVYYWQVRASDGTNTTYSDSNTWWSFKTGSASRPSRKELAAASHVPAADQNATGDEYLVPTTMANLIQDPGFEAYTPNPYWAEADSEFGTPLCTQADCGVWSDAHQRSGNVWAWFGGAQVATHTASLSQSVVFPSCGHATLRFYFWIGYAFPGSGTNDVFYAKIDGTTVFSANATQQSSYAAYTLISVNANAFANGAAHTIQFSHINTGQDVGFMLDDISLVGCPSISGNAGVASAKLSYPGGFKIADGTGHYSFDVPPGWSGTVTPSKAGYVFSPTNRTYSNVVTDQGVQNYTATPIYSISGNVGVAGVTLSYVDGSPKTATSQSNGDYSLTVLGSWTGTVTPTHPCFTFTPTSRSYNSISGNQTSQNYTPAFNNASGCADIDVTVGGTSQGRFGIPSPGSTRASFSGLNNGPVKVSSTNAVPLLGAERVIYKVSNIPTSFTEMMALPNGQLDTTYWLPWYNNVDLDTQLRFANATGSTAHVHIIIGTTEMPGSPFTLAPGESTRQSFAGVNNGPVEIQSDQNIVAAERVIYSVSGKQTSFSEMMALSNSQLNTTYWLPWYNNVDLDTQLRIGNVSSNPATVRIFIGTTEVTPVSGISLLAGESTRVSYSGVNNGPVKIQSDQNIVAAERVIYKVNNVPTSFTEMMALPDSQLNTIYWLPWYNNVDLDTQLRFANVTNNTAHVHVFVGGTEMAGSPFTLLTGQSTRVSFAGINNGPVKIQSDQNIVAAERVIYKVNNINTSFSEMMGLPNSQLDTIYWLPWYNNVDLDTQLRFGVP